MPRQSFTSPLSVALCTVSALAAGACTAESESAAAPLTCEISLTETAGGQRISGLAHASRDTDGHYRLQISQSGPAGRSTIVQSGTFSLAAGETARLGETTLGGTGNRRDAELTIETGGPTDCRASHGQADL